MKYLVYYNKIEDQLYITKEGHTAWSYLGDRQEVVISTIFWVDNRYWYYIGEL